MNNETKIRFLGSGSAHPALGNDTASYVVNNHILVDTGWNVVGNLKACGIDPKQIDYLLFTHMHHDHYLSLPSLLFELMDSEQSLSQLKIIGPDEDVQRVVALALQFLQVAEFYPHKPAPTIIPLIPGQSFEAEDFRFDTHATMHPVQGLCYRMEDKRTGKMFTITGDTAFHPPLASFIRGSSLLITEASCGPGKADPEHNPYMHSGAEEAAQLAVEAGVSELFLVHGPDSASQASVESAKIIFSGSVEWPRCGQEVIVK